VCVRVRACVCVCVYMCVCVFEYLDLFTLSYMDRCAAHSIVGTQIHCAQRVFYLRPRALTAKQRVSFNHITISKVPVYSLKKRASGLFLDNGPPRGGP
jgi:hypothetical protein